MSESSTSDVATSSASGVSSADRLGSAPAPRRNGSPDTGVGRGRQTGRWTTIIVLIGALLVAGITRQVALGIQEQQSPAGRRTASTSGASLAGMDTYALALLLGGLRGPLVMVLWANSETQKADRNLEGIDTQIEWIRRLQPEFDTVHVFQMWNKAYNLSVQMVGLSNKYTTILDALDYGRNIDAERPDNLNIIREIGRIYGDKLAAANPEKYYYRSRIRRETQHRDDASAARRGEPGFQRLNHDTMLDPRGNILSHLLRPRFDPEAGRVYNGSELQFLKQFEPFPYGLSPYALGYNYQKRAQMLMKEFGQKPHQISEAVQDSQPALLLRGWAEEEWERGRRLEFQAFGQKLPTERLEQETPTASVPVDGGFMDASVLPELLYSYDRSIRVVGDSLAEYERHLRNPEYATKRTMYGSHMDHLIAMRALVSGDRDYIRAMQAEGEQRRKLLRSAEHHYRDAVRDFGLLTLRYFTGDHIAAAVLPQGVNRANIGTGGPGSITAVTDGDIVRLMNAVRQHLERGGPNVWDENAEDRAEYETYTARAMDRIAQIQQAMNR